MGYFPREKLLDKTGDSIYKLVILASKRALELAEGKPKLVEADSAVKLSTLALMEIAQGKVQCKK
jgi:DNA-directed RNA polymerase omega subunit